MPYTKLKRVNSQILKNIIILQQSYGFNGLEVLMGGNVGSNTQDEDGKTLLMYKYILHCDEPNVKQFVDYFQPDVTLQDRTGRTAADYARENGYHTDAWFLYNKEIEASKLSVQRKQELQHQLYEYYSKYNGDKYKINKLKDILQQFRGVSEDSFKVKTQANYEEIIERQQKQLAEALKGNGNTQILQNLANSECDFSKINLNSDSYQHLSRENKKIIRQRQQEQLAEALQGNGDKQILQNLANSGYDFSKINLNVYPYNYFLSRDNVYIIQQRQQEQLAEALKGNGNRRILQNLANSECDFSKINLNVYPYNYFLFRDNVYIIQERQQKQLEEALQGNGDTQILQNLANSGYDFSKINLNAYPYNYFLSRDNVYIIQQRQQEQLEEALKGRGNIQIIQNLSNAECDFSKINLNSDSYQHLSEDNKKIVHERQQEQLEKALRSYGNNTQILQNLANYGYDFSKINLNSYKHLSEDNKKIVQERQQIQLEEALQGNGNTQIIQNLSNAECDFSKINLNSDSYQHLSEDNKKIVHERQQEQLEKALQDNGNTQILQNLANYGYDFSKINLNSYQHLSEINKIIIQQRQQRQLEEALQEGGNTQILQNLANYGYDFSKINLKADLCVHLSEDNKKIIQERQQKQLEEALQGNGDTQILQNLANSGYDFSKINLKSDSYKYLSGENKKLIRQRQQEQLEEALQTNSSKEKLQILINFGCDFSRINLNSDSYQHLSEENKKIIQEKQHEQLEEALKGNGNKRILQNLVDSEFDFSRVNLNLYSHKFLSKNNKEIVQKGKQKQLKKALQGNGDKRMLEILANFGCDFSRINLNSELYENLSKDNKRIIRQRQQIQLEEALRGNGNRRILQNLAKSGCDFSKINLKADSCVHLSEDNKKIIQERQEKQAMEREQNTQQASMQPIWRRNLGVCGTSSANQSQNTHLGQNHAIPGAQQPPAVRGVGNQGNQRGNVNGMGG